MQNRHGNQTVDISDGIFDNAATSFNYNGDGTVNYIDYTLQSGEVFRVTFSYSGGNVSSISAPVKQ